MLALSSPSTLPVRASFLALDPATDQLVPAPRTLVEFRIGPLVAAFLLLFTLAHLLIASPRVFDWYARNLRRGINYARWIEYARARH